MTTIAYRDGIIAADSAVSSCGSNVGMTEKITVIMSRPKRYIGFCGELAILPYFIDWYRAGANPKKAPDVLKNGNFDAMVVWRPVKHKEEVKVIIYDSVLGPMDMTSSPFVAVGSGTSAALAAMYAGASAEEAVEIAAKVDLHTRLPVVTYEV